MTWSSRKKEDSTFLYRLFFPKEIFLTFMLYLICVLDTLSKYTYFYISKNINSYTFSLVFKFVKSLQFIFK